MHVAFAWLLVCHLDTSVLSSSGKAESGRRSGEMNCPGNYGRSISIKAVIDPGGSESFPECSTIIARCEPGSWSDGSCSGKGRGHLFADQGWRRTVLGNLSWESEGHCPEEPVLPAHRTTARGIFLLPHSTLPWMGLDQRNQPKPSPSSVPEESKGLAHCLTWHFPRLVSRPGVLYFFF